MVLQLRHKTPKRRVKAKLREDRRPATRSNETLAMDFVHDQLANGSSCVKVVFNGNTIFRHRYFRSPRWTVLARILSISPQRINGHDKIAISPPFWLTANPRVGTVGVDGVIVTLSVSPQGLKLRSRLTETAA